ncbi:hypothetical protein BJ508DRAFT_379079 [Ascobolus immersus RN42]|uniref:F-box domain-containing protein n=1 Tax=Ascobolus immersus RN42 TaxID=1160509 RepID=A0A3N4HTI8_ASCIM|nr:hypothetical protein BJ508DRAFT_379079 [Ascobolus immersus RN42]
MSTESPPITSRDCSLAMKPDSDTVLDPHGSFPFLQLPNELLHQIITHLTNPHTFLALSRVNHRLRSITQSRPTRKAFVTLWLQTHPYCPKAPHLIKHILQFTRRHCLRPHHCHHNLNFEQPLMPPRFGTGELPLDKFFYRHRYEEPDANGRMSGYRSYLRQFSELSTKWLRRYVVRLAESYGDAGGPSGRVGEVELDVEDVVLGYAIYERSRERKGEGKWEEVRRGRLRDYWYWDMYDWACRCGCDVPVEGGGRR